MAKAGNYYYDQLKKEQQRAYYAMKEGLWNLQDSFAVPMLSKKELSDIYFILRKEILWYHLHCRRIWIILIRKSH